MDNEKQIKILNIDDILPNRFQPRIKFNEQAINELAESIRLHGVIQPIVVRRISDKYEIIAGERRYKASIIAGKTTIPAIITSLDDKNSAEVALIENVQRQDLTPIEEAISYKKILDMGYINQEALGEKLGKKQSTIANKLRLLNLSDDVQEALMENKISERHARSLLRLDEKKQILMLNRIINERLTVRKTDEEIEKLLKNEDNSSEEGTQKEKGENIMENNNDIFKEFNIPNEPIVDDNLQSMTSIESKESTNVNENIFSNVETTDQPNSFINPGFMDIQKIQNEAQDIKEPESKTADLDQLLHSEIPKVESVKEEPQPTGKFFNMFSEPVKDDNFVVDLEKTQVNMDFSEPVKDTNVFFNKPIEQENNVFDTQITTQPDLSTNIPEQSLENASQEQTNSQVENNIYNSTVQPIVSVENNSFDLENDTLENFSNTVNAFSLTDEETFSNNIQPQLNTEIPNFNNSINTENFDIQRPYQMDDNIKFDSNGDIEVQLERKNERYVTADMKTIINTIRNCAETIEKYGYTVDTDEVDLPDVYEVTFHIEKNN